MPATVYDALGGDDAVLALARAWHTRCLADPVMAHPFSHPGHPQHVERLAAYWAEALGGPDAYSASMGDHSHVLRMHAGNGEHEEMDARAVACFEAALDDVGVQDEPLRSTLEAWWRWSVDAMAAYPASAADVPGGLPFPRWSWDGPVAPAR
ncbi:globin [Beutenbergia cavernae DSM 12333]|uniref:Globin n=1 Tax=Beutenbergia cavernae (strain ATCC BAA-8 / DSM 12333 / CCUG 43141 / JCM 11478 / NBRC 16432 / NCIMB 13614 / HKI 0122) TaxID=471853 RepID=C5C0X0_BEUC1|nr:group II truncated hemoglobin [Beutenbergia cavernae]ACQ79374.1 globin [Beutenbergia cavernae DSM 12333]